MKLLVTHLKAPWPNGTKVGDVVTIKGNAVPAWAAGKCSVLPEDDEGDKPKSKGKGSDEGDKQ